MSQTLILGIETSGDSAGAALGTENEILFSKMLKAPRRHSENLPGIIEEAFSKTGVQKSDLNMVAVNLGPGFYTGLRVGVATAMAMSWGLKIPSVGFCGLDILAKSADIPTDFEGTLIPILDAKRKEVFSARYEFKDKKLKRTSDHEVKEVHVLKKEMENTKGPVLVFGDKDFVFDPPDSVLFRHAIPDPQMLVSEALEIYKNSKDFAPEKLRPIYLRDADARPNISAGAK